MPLAGKGHSTRPARAADVYAAAQQRLLRDSPRSQLRQRRLHVLGGNWAKTRQMDLQPAEIETIHENMLQQLLITCLLFPHRLSWL
ncbi:MAG: hypothetical protein GPOALKHO_000579 [Sodalis sp.]|nr:MAG: hypothetical protein GPOALKHO_000579 [Sodalis sp.]